MYYVIANKDNSKFIAIDSNSGGYPYETNYFPHAKIGLYESINEEYKDLDNCGIDSSEYFIKKVVIINF